MDIESFVCKHYGVSKKKISDKKAFKLLTILQKEFYDIRIIDCERDNCNYDCLIQVGQESKEEQPDNIGMGWGLKEAILSTIICDRVMDDCFARDSIRWELSSPVERLKQIMGLQE